MKNELLIQFICLQEQLRVLHWQTKSYARHEAYGKKYDSIGELVDSFMEIYMGKYGTVEFDGEEGVISLKNTKSLDLNEFIKSNLEFLISLNDRLDGKKDTDLLNLKDEMMAELNQLRYLLSLK
jgi:hypothetical protein